MIRALGRVGDGELHPPLTAAALAVVLGHGGAAVFADVAAVIGGEDHRLRHWDGPFADLLASSLITPLKDLHHSSLRSMRSAASRDDQEATPAPTRRLPSSFDQR